MREETQKIELKCDGCKEPFGVGTTIYVARFGSTIRDLCKTCCQKAIDFIDRNISTYETEVITKGL